MPHIYLAPIYFPAQPLEKLSESIASTFHSPVSILQFAGSLQEAFDENMSQYSTLILIGELLRQIPDEECKILGVTELDLFTPVLTFVFGEAQLNGAAAIVSSYRLKNSLYGLPDDPELTTERLIKVAVHELGHTFDLVHCRYYTCVMYASTCVEEVDMKSKAFCSACMSMVNDKMRTSR